MPKNNNHYNKKNFIKQIIKILYPQRPTHRNRAIRITPTTVTVQLTVANATMAASSSSIVDVIVVGSGIVVVVQTGNVQGDGGVVPQPSSSRGKRVIL